MPAPYDALPDARFRSADYCHLLRMLTLALSCLSMLIFPLFIIFIEVCPYLFNAVVGGVAQAV